MEKSMKSSMKFSVASRDEVPGSVYISNLFLEGKTSCEPDCKIFEYSFHNNSIEKE